MKEIRSFDLTAPSEESRNIEGYGVVFGKESVDLGGFTEVIAPGAITDEVIRNSDIFLLLDHSRERGVLARSRYGEGSLSVSVDEQGVYYHCDAPRTALGDEVLEGIRRKDIGKCSFAFTVAEDKWSKDADGKVLRTITSIDRIYDLSIVYSPAYEDTIVVNKRGLEEMEEPEKEETPTEDPEQGEEERSEEPTEQEEAPTEEPEAEESETDQEEEDKNNDAEPETEERGDNLYPQNNIVNTKRMAKKFSLIGAINDAIARRSTDFVKDGKIVLPLETRADGDEAPATPATPSNGVAPNGIMQSEATLGHETVKQSMWDLYTDLKNRLILSELGATFMTADSEISIPKFTSGSCAWIGEVDHAVDAAGKFESTKVTPKRLSAYLDISNTWLRMTGANAESVIRQELIDCIAQKIQETIFSNQAETDLRPGGLLYNITADSKDFGFKDAIAMQEALEEVNCYSDSVKFAANPKAKHYLRSVPVDAGSGKFVLENNEILGTPCLSSNSIISKGLILGDWRELFIIMFSNMTIVTDTLTRAAYDQTRLIVNLSVSAVVRRPECFIKRILK